MKGVKMLKIDINKDIDDYAQGLFLGLSLKEICNFILIAIISFASIFLLSQVLPFVLAVYLSLPVILVVAIAGKKIGNMTAREIIAYLKTFNQLKKGIEFSSTENPCNMPILVDENPRAEGSKENDNEKTKE